MANNSLDLKYVQQEITALLLLHPDLEDDEILRADSIEGETTAFEFMSRIVRLIGDAKILMTGTTEYIGELQERKARYERRIEALRSLIFKVMSTADLRKLELPQATLSVRQGQPKVVIINENEIPAEFWRVRREVDKIKLKAVLGVREHVPGAVLSNAESVLAILTK